MTGWSALLGALGAVALGFGILTAIIAIFQPLMDFGWVLANLLVGVVLLGAAVASSVDSLRERMASGEARRVGKYGGSALLGTILGIAILCAVAFLSTRYSQRFDWTEQKVNTLSGQTLSVLAELAPGDATASVELLAFFRQQDAPEVRGPSRRRGEASTKYLRNLISGEQIIIRTVKDSRGTDRKGSFGRWLGTIYLNGVDINRHMVAAGHADFSDR